MKSFYKTKSKLSTKSIKSEAKENENLQKEEEKKRLSSFF